MPKECLDITDCVCQIKSNKPVVTTTQDQPMRCHSRFISNTTNPISALSDRSQLSCVPSITCADSNTLNFNSFQLNFERSLLESPFPSSGHFGTALSKLGDINKDGYKGKFAVCKCINFYIHHLYLLSVFALEKMLPLALHSPVRNAMVLLPFILAVQMVSKLNPGRY